MTKREIELARNENEQTYRKLSPEAQAAVRKAIAEGVAQYVAGDGNARAWPNTITEDGHVYTIATNVKPEDETPEGCEDVEVSIGETGYYRYVRWGVSVVLSAVLAHSAFVGIGYELDGKVTLRTSVDAAFGVPKFVRFRK